MATTRNSDSARAGTTLTSHHDLIRLINDTLVVTNATFDLVMDIVPGRDKKEQARLIGHMKLWLDNVLEGSIIIPMNKDFDPSYLASLKNNLIFCPDEPYDIVVQVMVHAKLNAIGQGLVTVERSHMSTAQGNGFGTWFDGDPDELLPSQADWMGERCYFPLPWWHRSDGSTIDIMANPEDDISRKPDILLDIAELDPSDGDTSGDSPSAEIIKPDFKPRIVKDD